MSLILEIPLLAHGCRELGMIRTPVRLADFPTLAVAFVRQLFPTTGEVVHTDENILFGRFTTCLGIAVTTVRGYDPSGGEDGWKYYTAHYAFLNR